MYIIIMVTNSRNWIDSLRGATEVNMAAKVSNRGKVKR